MIIKTESLEGLALDYAMAISKGYAVGELKGHPGVLCLGKNGACQSLLSGGDALLALRYGYYKPSTDWNQGGPILEAMYKRGLSLERVGTENFGYRAAYAIDGVDDNYLYGITPLQVAMKCFVIEKLGLKMDIPDRLITSNMLINESTPAEDHKISETDYVMIDRVMFLKAESVQYTENPESKNLVLFKAQNIEDQYFNLGGASFMDSDDEYYADDVIAVKGDIYYSSDIKDIDKPFRILNMEIVNIDHYPELIQNITEDEKFIPTTVFEVNEMAKDLDKKLGVYKSPSRRP